MIASSSLSSSVCVGGGFTEDFLDLALDRFGVGGTFSKFCSALVLCDEDFERFDFVTAVDFFDDKVVSELARVD